MGELAIERILVNFGVPVFICVILPVVVVWLVTRAKQNETNRKADIMLKAIEAGVPVDMEQFKSAKKKAPVSIKQELLDKLNGACITSLMGIGFLTLGILRVVITDFGRNTLLNKFWLPAGCVLLAVGIGLFISYFVGKKLLAKEIEAEEKQLEQ